MKVFNTHEIKNAFECVSKRVETNITPTVEHSENSSYITNSLECLSNSARAIIDENRTALQIRYADLLTKYEEGTLKNEYIINSEGIIKDLELLKKGGRLIDEYIPIFSSKEEALAQAKMDDVIQIRGDKTVSIMNSSGEIEPLKMDRKSYFKLFPPVERFMGTQSDSYGICYEVNALNTVMERPETREAILKSIDTVSEKGKIKITFPNGKPEGTTFSPDEIEKEGLEYYMKGCDGLKYIEHALGKEYEIPFIEYTISQLEKSGQTDLAKRIQQLYKWGDYDEIAKLCGADNKASLATNLREAGDSIVPWRLLGFERNSTVETGDYLSKVKDGNRLIDDRHWLIEVFEDNNVITDSENFAECIWSPEFFEKHLVEAYVGNKNSLSPLYALHSYRLAPILDNNGKIQDYALKNPHNTIDEKISFEDIFDMIDSISFAKIK